MCNVEVVDYVVNVTSTATPDGDASDDDASDDDASLDLDSFQVPF